MTGRWGVLWTLVSAIVSLPSKSAWNLSDCRCGWYMTSTVQQTLFTRRIIGGLNTKVHEFPMMAALLDLYYDQLYCGATVVATRYAVTAAHCTINRNVRNIALLLGDHDIATNLDTEDAHLLPLLRFIVHPDYDMDSQFNDIALVHLNKNIEFNAMVGPACLPFNYVQDSFVGKTVLALGWGVTKFEGVGSNVLKKVDLSVVTNKECLRIYQGTTSSDQICTYAQGKDACQNDSGGPILWINKKRVYLVGVISYGVACATKMPGVNTRVTSYMDWIRNTTPEVSYCIY